MSGAIRELARFFGLAFAITWLVTGAFIFFGDWLEPVLGPMTSSSPWFFFAVFGPSLAALFLSWRDDGGAGLRRLLGSAARWRVGAGWLTVALIGYPALWLVWALVRWGLGLDDGAPLRLDRWYQLYPLVILGGHLFRDPGALGEELGWRGYALPRLLSVMSPLPAALLLGVIWAVWHLPAFYLPGLSQSKIDFAGFVVTVTCFSVLMTWLFVRTGGSVLVAGILPHMSFNAIGPAGISPSPGVLIVVTAALAIDLAVRARRGRAPLTG